ncbi:MAG: hypothetical protein Q9164_000047 [Protoblastenia rupestris]
MSPKKLSSSKKTPASDTSKTDPATKTVFLGRDGLGAYIADPTSFPSSRVVYHDEKWVVINDLFPKSSIHLLLLPRNPAKELLHPFDAFEDPTFLSQIQAEVQKLRTLAAKELKRRFGKYSRKEQAREAALESDTGTLPEGRDWEKEIISGIHAGPSMSHLHVHVLSVDRYSECMRHRKHYNSFSTPFLIDVEDFPLAKDDPRRHPGRHGYLDRDLICWRCGKGFGRSFAKLKEHVDGEFERWRAD